MNSVNTNPLAVEGLQALNATSTQIAQTENVISTGLVVATPKENGAVWAIAQSVRSQISSWQTIGQSQARGQSILATAMNGATAISNILNQVKADALSLSDTSLDATSQASLKADVSALIAQINQTASGATFDGVNLLTGDGTDLNPPPMYPAPAGDQHVDWTPDQNLGPGTYSFTFNAPPGSYYGFDVQAPGAGGLITSYAQPGPTLTTHADGNATSLGAWCPLGAQLVSATFTPDDPPPPIQIVTDTNGGQTTLTQYDLTSSGLGLNNLDFTNPTIANSTIQSAIASANSAAGQIGSQQSSLSNAQTQATNMENALNTGLGNLIDADMAKESASLQSKIAKQQLAASALSIANASPQWLLQLFK